MNAWIPFLVAIIGAVGAAGTFLFQKYVERKDRQEHERKKVYVEYLSAISDYMNAIPVNSKLEGNLEANRKARHRLTFAAGQLQLFATDGVARSTVDLDFALASLNYWVAHHDGENVDSEILHRVAFHQTNTVRHMRADLFKTDFVPLKLSEKELVEKMKAE